ncbi:MULTISPECIES: type II secretion system F family protein [Ramlibacter]|uniref:Type II secretion system F family protein n=1 Tax=Ramlibacter aquaticus TaxID=2780094 RepID=A0ABR9SAE1_9BURK|nr:MULTISPECIES: type II secretion system F family protein [Ramlibacter]MBE7939296.1 type II secretion system F family protein [Ramlibacter aquaticus]
MDVYEYIGRNKRGEAMRGSMEALSPQAVAAWLAGSEISPVSIRLQSTQAAKTPEWLVRLKGSDKVHDKDLLLFTRQMANMVKAGLQVIEAIEGIQRSTSSLALSKVLGAIREDLDRGAVLSTAFGRHPDVFTDYYVNMVKVGEGTGELEDAFHNLYKQLDFDRQMRLRMKTAMRYPTFVVIALFIAISVVTLFVIPKFSTTYANMHVELPLLTRLLVATSNFAVSYWWLILFGAGVVYYIVQMVLRSADGRYSWDKWKLRLPVVGEVLTKATIARFSRSFATALKADVPIVMAFQLVAKVVDNTFFEDRILAMRRGVERGEVMSRVMRTSGIFSPLELQLIQVGERTGEVDRAVEDIAEMYTEEVEYAVDRLSQSIEPILLVLMGVLVLILILGIFLPLWDLGAASLHRGQ